LLLLLLLKEAPSRGKVQEECKGADGES